MDTPISFGTDGWRATLDEFTSPRVQIVGQAVADYLREVEDRAGETVAISYDARDTSRGFAEDLCRVLAANGFDVLVAERDTPTPILAWTLVDRDLAGGLMITASHNPPEYNGVKFIPSDGAPALPEVTDEIMARLAEPDPLPESEYGSVSEEDLVEPYEKHAFDLVDADFDGLSVVYDAMHGSGRGITDRLLEDAGASVERLNCDQDPEFGGTPPEPSEENLQDLIEAVEDGDADLGIANDGDADRIAIVTPERGYLDENLVFAALYEYLLEDESGPAVRSVSTTFLIDRIAEEHGEEVHETPVGFKWLAESMGEHDALIGGEESGGFTIRGHVREKDGVLMALLTAAVAHERPFDDRVDDLLAEFGEIHQGKVSLDCPDDEKERVLDDLETELPDEVAGKDVADMVTKDGFKILLADGSWLLVRPSGTEPKMRIYAEGESEDAVADLLDAGKELVAPLI
ncbi:MULTISPECIES: phosphoglucomutase/phosphomannomutase family protein [unclassified Haladaptatus]|uniref:phosphoglucomutase/phosphomannomutase family protein n=1 Tax=unclassified Haladaptatus TaxID=2622732 RepID=UPI00209C3082|nr:MULTISPECIES: phosphoglucomutase/phosphomannomutase family protein [unclassified Haladaptatus]MCO8246840.1 phosphoglucomutase/phosphomannomutase family protein [Haladaptatus sp. AB643]MCO8253634.1 phosphoglucomutase/phosphomannomutase family protein [Haladaptatus sp. AB618]